MVQSIFVLGWKRCFKCRSRGELGSCKDPFSYTNTSAVEHIAGVETIPCSSGWCGKVQEGGANSFKDEGIIKSWIFYLVKYINIRPK